MRSPAQAIFWEICARNRWTLLFAFGLIPFCVLLRAIVGTGHELVRVAHVISAIMTFTSLVWVCSYTANDSRGRFGGFPSWTYTFPARTSLLVICPMLLGLILTLTAVAAWEVAISLCWALPVEPKNLGWHALLFVGALFSTQAVIWCLHRFRWIRVATLVAVFYAFLHVGLVGHTFRFSGAALWFGGVSLVIPLAFVGALAGVARDRRGGWQGWTGKLLEQLLDLIPRRSGAFASPARAQLWIEWRRKGFFLVIVFAATMALSMCLFPLGAALYLPPVETMFHFSSPFILMILFSGILGGAIAKSDLWSQELGLHPIVVTKPLTTGELVFAKMKAAALATCLAWMLFAILLVPVIGLHGRLFWWSDTAPNFWKDFPVNFPRFFGWVTNPIVWLAVAAATWHTAVQTMAVAMTGDRKRIVRSAWQGMVVLAIVISTAVWLYKNRLWVDSFLQFLPWFTAAIMALKAWGAWRAFTAVRPLVSRRELSILLGLWFAVAILVLAAGTFAHHTRGLPASLLWLLVLWQFFPAGEIPQCVVALTFDRHR